MPPSREDVAFMIEQALKPVWAKIRALELDSHPPIDREEIAAEAVRIASEHIAGKTP